jgi:DUF4097 and DUF4098 domain-containing protein YvlB
MKTRSVRPLIVALWAVAILATLPAAVAADAKGGFTKTLKVTGSADVDVSTGSGNITITTGDATTVSIRATITANDRWFGTDSLSAAEKVKRIENNPPVEQSGNVITIGKIQDRELRNNVSITYDITLPASSKVRAQTGSGDQYITGVNGTVKLSTGSGNVNARQIGDETRVSTGSGDIKVESIKGRVYASAGSGNVQAWGVAGGFVGETGSGDITYEQTAPGSVTAKTGSGNITLKNVTGGLEAHTGSGDINADGDVKADWQAHSGSGNISLRLPKDAAFNLDARSSSGTVSVDHPVTVQGSMKPNRILGKVGAGGVLVSLESGSGDIRVK